MTCTQLKVKQFRVSPSLLYADSIIPLAYLPFSNGLVTCWLSLISGLNLCLVTCHCWSLRIDQLEKHGSNSVARSFGRKGCEPLKLLENVELTSVLEKLHYPITSQTSLFGAITPLSTKLFINLMLKHEVQILHSSFYLRPSRNRSKPLASFCRICDPSVLISRHLSLIIIATNLLMKLMSNEIRHSTL